MSYAAAKSDFGTPSSRVGSRFYSSSLRSPAVAAHSTTTSMTPMRAAPYGSYCGNSAPLNSNSRNTPARNTAQSSSYMSSSSCPVDGEIDVSELGGAATSSAKYTSRLRNAVAAHADPPTAYNNTASTSRDGAGVGVFDELIGFANIGNTCFMNSTLQCLLRCQRLKTFLLASDLDRVAPRPAPLTATMQDICRRMFSSSGGSSAQPHAQLQRSIAPSNFKNCFASYRKAFAGYEQHDAHEFLRFSLDAMHDECNTVVKRPPYEELKDIDREDVRDTASRWFQNHLRRNASIVQESFCGQFASETECQDCRHRSASCETFLDLSVPVPRSGFGVVPASDAQFSISRAVQATSSTAAVTLGAALREFFSPVTLAGEDAYKCPKCNRPTTAHRTTSLFLLPEVLVVHLKRFRHSRFHATKINDLVQFPVDEELDVSEFLHQQSPQRASAEQCRYVLSGVVHHMGSTHSGHYVANCRCDTRGGSGGRWYEFNDSSVDAVRQSSSIVSPSAYILFFEKSSSFREPSKL